MAKNKKTGTKTAVAVLVILLALAAAGYAASKGALGTGAYNLMQAILPHAEPAPADPQHEADPAESPGDRPEEPPSGDPTAPGSTPVIYAGQLLHVPVPGEAASSGASLVISEGTIPTDSMLIALTFDSGWEFEQTISLLDVLDRHKITATFFPRAKWLEDHPDLAREIVSRGHTVGNHSLTHPDMTKLSNAEMLDEIRQSTAIINRTTGIRPYLFRPPYGEYNQQMLDILGQEGYPYTIMWTVDTHDWAENIDGEKVTVDYVINRVLGGARPGAIMLMHVGGPKTVQALPRIITGLKEMGYTFTSVDKMLPAPGVGQTVHKVEKGETLYGISKKYGVTVQQIIDANHLDD